MATNRTADRIAEKAAKRGGRRVNHFAQRINAASTAELALSEACQYLRAVARRLPEGEKRDLIDRVVQLADERNEQ